MERLTQNRTAIIVVALLMISALHANGQSHGRSLERHIAVTLFDEHIAAPFSVRSDSPAHWGLSVSLETLRRVENPFQYSNVIQLGYYYHQNFNQVAFLAWKPKFELRFANIISVHAMPGIGYAHSFPTQTSYKLEQGKYRKTTNRGKSHAMPSLGFGAGVNLYRIWGVPMEVFGRYEFFGLAPYSLNGSIPVTLNTMTSLGIRFSISRKF